MIPANVTFEVKVALNSCAGCQKHVCLSQPRLAKELLIDLLSVANEINEMIVQISIQISRNISLSACTYN